MEQQQVVRRTGMVVWCLHNPCHNLSCSRTLLYYFVSTFFTFPQLHSNISRPIYVLPFSEIILTVFIQECLRFAADQVSPEKKKFPRPLPDAGTSTG